MKFILESIAHESGDISTLWFKTDSPLRYEAGQFVELTLPHDNADERGVKHWFTLSSSPTEKLVSITTRNFGNKASSFKKTLFGLQTGTIIQASEAMGDFVLPKDTKRPLLFVAGGIGITPMRSIAKYLQDTKQTRHVGLLYAVHDVQNLVFTDLFKSVGAKVVSLIGSKPGTQRLSSSLILEYALSNSLVYISGPEPMTEQLVDELKLAGVSEDRLVTDYFPGYDNEYATQRA